MNGIQCYKTWLLGFGTMSVGDDVARRRWSHCGKSLARGCVIQVYQCIRIEYSPFSFRSILYIQFVLDTVAKENNIVTNVILNGFSNDYLRFGYEILLPSFYRGSKV